MDEAPVLRAVWAAAGLLAALGAAAWWLLRRAAPGGTFFGLRRAAPGTPLRRLARLPLTPHHALHVVEWQGHQWLVGTGGHGLTVHSIPAPGRFAAELAGALGSGEEREAEDRR